MKTPLGLWTFAIAALAAVACGPHYPHDPVPCTADTDCASGQSCISEWTQTDGGTADGGISCLSTRKVCQKACTADPDCSYCGAFGICAVDICDTTGPRTCGTFCGAGK